MKPLFYLILTVTCRKPWMRANEIAVFADQNDPSAAPSPAENDGFPFPRNTFVWGNVTLFFGTTL